MHIANMRPTFQAITPRVPVESIEDALAFYRDQLGFDLGWTWGTPPTHANVCRDSISIDLVVAPTGNAGTAMAYVQVQGIDAYYAEVTTRGTLVGGLGDRPYGMRDFEVIDPDGNRLAFGESAPG